MKIKQLCALSMVGFGCFLGYNCPMQADNGNGNQYNEVQKDYPNNNQPMQEEDESSGATYVMPWNENQEYYGEPPPQVLDSKPPPQQQQQQQQNPYNSLNQLPNNN